MKWLVLPLLLTFCSSCFAANYQAGIGTTERSGIALLFSITPDSNSSIKSRVDIGAVQNAGGFQGINENFKFVGLSAFWQYKRFSAGIGILELNHSTHFLTSKYQFIETVGIRLNPLIGLEFHHISNGNTAGTNFGDNLLTLNFSF